jgi:uncharacterized protein (UPF0332 family)
LDLEEFKMNQLPFTKEIIDGNAEALAHAVPEKNQARFCQRVRRDFQQATGNTVVCFEWGWRCFKAMRSLLMSGALFVDSVRAWKKEFLEAFPCYGLYYSFFHASYALLCLHPQIKIETLRNTGHGLLINAIRSKFEQTGVLPTTYLENLKHLKVLRELTTYFAPMGGLESSSDSKKRFS